MIPFAPLVARWRHFRRDRVAILLAAHDHEEALRGHLRAEAERIIYSGDHPRCDACIVGWDERADRCGLITPCADYPACSIPAPTGRHRLTWTEAEL